MNVDGFQRNSDFPNTPLFARRNLPNWHFLQAANSEKLLHTLNVEVQVHRIRINAKLKSISQTKLQMKFLHGAAPTSKFLSFHQLNVVQITNVSINYSLHKNREVQSQKWRTADWMIGIRFPSWIRAFGRTATETHPPKHTFLRRGSKAGGPMS
jgi:hypothetical protein